MLAITPHMKIFVAVEPIDFRRGIDGLAQACRARLGQEPMDGAVFVFRNRRRNAIKLLVYDGQGFWLCYKRLSSSSLPWWPKSSGASVNLEAHQLQVLLSAGDPSKTQSLPAWRPLQVA